MSGEWSSSMVTISDREGLFAPAFCALIVRSVRIVAAGGAAVGDCACFSMRCVTRGVIGSVDVGFAGGKAPVGSLLCWVGFPSGVAGRPSGEDLGSSPGRGEPGGE